VNRWVVAAALLTLIGAPAAARAQVGRLPGIRPSRPTATRNDSAHKDTLVKWPTPDSVMQRLLDKRGYSITRYLGDTARFDTQTHALDLLPAKKHNAVVQRDSETIVSDSGIYYRQDTRHGVTGGHYVIVPPASSGTSQIVGHGREDFDLARHAFTVSQARLPYDVWFMTVNHAEIVEDTTTAKRSSTTYVHGGSLTSCDDSIPDYRFVYDHAKRTSANTIVAAPAVLYIKDIPILWLPFLFSDTRSGRHSRLLPPQFGLGDVVRNSPTYRRNVDHLGYYWALNDYMDASTWLDWRSSAGATPADPGWLRLNGDWDYKWLDRFMSGRVGLGYTEQRDGLTNLALTWEHTEAFSSTATLNTNINYVTSTTLQRQNTFNPYQALATIASSATFTDKFGPTSLNIGGTQTQYPGRQQLLRSFPTVSLTSTPISLGSNFSWTPGFSYSEQSTLHMDQPGPGAEVYNVNPTTGRLDSTASTSRGSFQSTTSFDTPITIFGYNIGNSFHIAQQQNNFPDQYTIYDVETGAITDTRIFASTYRTDIDWTPAFALPPIGRNLFNLTPTLSLQNVDPGPYWVATERSDGQFIQQSKRPTIGLSASPTIYGLFPGFGPFTRFRHSIQPTLSWTYAPAQSVSDAYLAALGETRQGYLGSLRQDAVSLGITQSLDAKYHKRGDTTDHAESIKLVSLVFNPLTYDIERAKYAQAHGLSLMRGFTSPTWGYSLSSDLLPGLDFSSSYSLFQGDAISDTAVFKPYLSTVSATVNFSRTQNPFTKFAEIFGRAVPEPLPRPPTGTPISASPTDSAQTQQIATMPVAGTADFSNRFITPPTDGWKASLSFALSRPRPPVGSNVIQVDPAARCAQIAAGNEFLQQYCLAQQIAAPTTDLPVNSTIAGGSLYALPPTASINSDIAFNLTPKWSAHWTTTYDVVHHAFASQIVDLQRELHDWRAIFGYTQSPNGNFAFTFTIALKADPDVKFDYNRATVPTGSVF
jgi:hypothetical protein